MQTEEPGDWHDQIEEIWWTGDFGMCGRERTNAALVGKCEGERQLRRSGTWVSLNFFWEWATPIIVP